MSDTFNPDFLGVRNYGDDGLMNHLENSMKSWVDYAMLRIGAWSHIDRGQDNAWGGSNDKLRYVHDPSYTDGQVWEGFRKDWVWETGIFYENPDGSGTFDPESVEVYVSNVQQTGDFEIDYCLGRVIFDTAKPTGSDIEASFSYRNVQTYVAHRSDWWQELQFLSFRSDDLHFTQDVQRGEWSIGGNHRLQMPSIVIEAVPRATSRPYQLGDASAWVEQDVLVHVLAENRNDRNDLADIFRGQFNKTLWLFDSNSVAMSGDYPLDSNGNVMNRGMHYSGLIEEQNGHRWEKGRFKRTQLVESVNLHPNLHYAQIRMTMELVLVNNRAADT